VLTRVEDPSGATAFRRNRLAEAELPGVQPLVERGLRVARGTAAERAAFHAGYVSVAGDPGVDALEVVTELRRVVLLAEAYLNAGEPLPDAGQLTEALRPYHGRLTVIVRIRFHPRNGYTAVPPLDLRLGTGFSMQPALEVRSGAIEDLAAAREGQPVISGAIVEGTFRAADEGAIQTLVIQVNNVYLMVATVDLSRMP